MQRRIAVLGLGYVGLPVALAFARRFPGTIGFDKNPERISALRDGEDATGAASSDELTGSELQFTSEVEDLRSADFYVVAVPTPIDHYHRPDLGALESASRTVGEVLSSGDIVVFESTVYPGVTEDVCGPILAAVSGLSCGTDFHLGYSPERINPGDEAHTLERTVKIVSAQDEETLATVAACYESIIDAGVHRAASIQVAEAAKVIENVQRDLNIALMNELAVIFDRLDLDSHAVFDAAATKWNFHRYHPGLVGGHCIGVDPYYLTAKAESIGIQPNVILAGRRVNDDMGRFVAWKAIKLLIASQRPVAQARVALLGITYKSDVPDIRNSRVPDIAAELAEYGVRVLVHDPLADAEEVRDEYGLELVGTSELQALDAVVLATPHQALEGLAYELAARDETRVLIDVLGALDRERFDSNVHYWRL